MLCDPLGQQAQGWRGNALSLESMLRVPSTKQLVSPSGAGTVEHVQSSQGNLKAEAGGPTAKSVPQAAEGWVWVAWHGALDGRGDCPPHSSGCGSEQQLVWGGGTWTRSQS